MSVHGGLGGGRGEGHVVADLAGGRGGGGGRAGCRGGGVDHTHAQGREAVHLVESVAEVGHELGTQLHVYAGGGGETA